MYMNIPTKGIYRHYKGNLYELLYIGKHSETLEDVVVYKALYGDNSIWVRPLNMWDEEINVDGRILKRFTLIEDKK